MRITLLDIKNSRAPNALELCPTDQKVIDYANAAGERLLNSGHWWGGYGRILTTMSSGEVVWPREVASVLSASVCDIPITMRGEFFEWLEYGVGIVTDTTDDLQYYTRPTVPLMKRTLGEDQKLSLVSDTAEDADEYVIIYGEDENDDKVWRTESGQKIEGEKVTVSAVAEVTTNTYSKVTSVQKGQTKGIITVTGVGDALTYAEWEPDELNPQYKCGLIPSCTANSLGSGEDIDIECMVKLNWKKLWRDSDWCMIQNVEAMKEMMIAVKHYENSRMEEGAPHEMTSIRLLENQLRHERGGVVDVLRVDKKSHYGNGLYNI